ncbi:YmaF family protein [Ectobacillus funiculus]|uniref:YmaF family protein n=1 Tax=Ectobacillus funiculus TaxID=137993 RepID=A0ABV5WLC2_9BACI
MESSIAFYVGSVDYTSVENSHVHQCLDVTSPPIATQDGGHIHYTEGSVVFEDGHTHHYKAYSGPAIPVGSGMHVHYYDFYTTEDNGHRHHVKGVDHPAPGNK